MSLKETKKYFENLFNDNWHETPIHFIGEDFDKDRGEEWINPVYSPSSSDSVSVSNDGRKSYGTLAVICWAKNDLNVMDLADRVVGFMEDNVEGNQYSLKGYNVEDHAYHEANKVYVYLSFTVTSYFC